MEVMLFDQYTIPAKFGTNWPGNSRGGMFYYVGHSETRSAYGIWLMYNIWCQSYAPELIEKWHNSVLCCIAIA
jgi:hypothetical protein